MLRRLSLALLVFAPAMGAAQQQSVTFGGFIDAFVAFDFGKPRAIDRAYTSQAARHGEFNVNLAFIDAVLDGDRVRGRLALQAGTSVQALYLTEPTVGNYSGGLLSRHLQEAAIGIRLREGLWIDGGIMLSHTGTESWVSRENPTYTRSLISDYSPYHESGVKLTWDVRDDFTALFAVVNGWQNVSENNPDKSFGVRFDWALSPRLSLSYYNLVGNEQPDTLAARLRFYNGVSLKWSSDEMSFTGTFDGGRQERPGIEAANWWGAAAIAHIQMTERTAVTGRFEAYYDPTQTVIVTGTRAFEVFGGSFGFDMEPNDGVIWRTEVRALKGHNAVFPDSGSPNGRSRSNTALVTSLAVTF
jgi:hypothetical protein